MSLSSPRSYRRRILAGVGAVSVVGTSIVLPATAFASSVSGVVVSGSSGNTYKASASSSLYAKQGATVTFTVTTSADTKCVTVTGAATVPRQTSDTAKSSWTFATTAPAGDGAQAFTIAASPDFNRNNCTGQTNSTQASYILDNTGPVVSSALSPAANGAGWNNANTRLSWTATDAGAGVSAAQPFAAEDVTTNGVHSKTAAAQSDRLGNVGAAGAATVRVDKVAPGVTATQTKNTDNTTTVTFTCTDDHSGVVTGTCVVEGTTSNSIIVSGNRTVYGVATDRAGHTTRIPVEVVNSDTTAPLLSGAPQGSPNGNGWYNGDVTVRWSASDPESGIPTPPADTKITGEGEALTSTTTVRNGDGLETTATSNPAVKIDRTKPTTAIRGTSNAWVNGTVNVSLVPDDNLSGPASTSYSINGAPAETGTSFSLANEGTHQVTYFSTDRAGNVEDTNTATIKIDKTAPTIGHAFTPSSYTDGAWTNQNVTVTFTCADQGGSTVASCTDPVTKSTEGRGQQVVGTATDGAGNSATDTATVSIDKTKPLITATADRAPNSNLAANGKGWYDKDVTVSYSASDDLSGVASKSPNAVLGQGANQSASGTATDEAGNSDSAGVSGINIDKTQPELSGTAPSGWHNGDVTVTWTASDALSGLAGAVPTPSLVTGEGDNLSATESVSDKAGNDKTTKVEGIKIDRTEPTTLASVPTVPASGWYRSGVQVTLTGSDNLSGATTYYTVNNGAQQTYSAPFTVSSAGTNTVKFWSVDGAGNVEEAGAPLTLNVDGDAPSTTVILPPPADSGWYLESGLPVAFKAVDGANSSGVAATYYQVDGGERRTYGQPFTEQLSTGEHTITFWSVDIAGNVEVKESITQTVSVKVDSEAPVITPGDVNDTTWRSTPLSQEFLANDGTSGSGLTDPADAKFTLEASAESTKEAGAVVPTTVTKTVTDKAGNATARKVSALIDVTKPSISGENQANTTWRNTPLTSGTFTASDALSGLQNEADASFTLTASADSASATAPTVATRTVKDKAGNAETRTLSALIDTAQPTIVGADQVSTTWRNTPLSGSFTASDTLSGLLNEADAGFTLTASADSASATAPTVVTRTVKDKAGNDKTATVSALIDTAAPTSVSFVNGPAADTRYYTSTVPAAPTCTATDGLSGLASCTISGHSTAEGTHTLTATAKDNAGNTTTATRSYTVKNLTRTGFFAPVDMNGVYNTIKGGNTVPLKFEVFDGTTELKTTTAVGATFTAAKINCTSGAEDAIEIFTTTGQTELRFDTTGDQFIQNWKTPTGSGCYKATLTTADGQSISALFKTLK